MDGERAREVERGKEMESGGGTGRQIGKESGIEVVRERWRGTEVEKDGKQERKWKRDRNSARARI